MKQNSSRREALRMLALGVAGSVVLPAIARGARYDNSGVAKDLSNGADSSPRIERIGLQLYTVRRALSTGIEPVMEALEKAGITELEFAGYYEKPASYWNELMRKHGMTAPATHIGLPSTNEAWTQHFERSNAMGHKWLIVPSSSPEFRSAEGWKRLAARLNAGGELAKSAGLRVGYHNHDYEFVKTSEGKTGLDTLLAETDPALVDFELDIYWAVKAGHDPMELLTKHSNRFTCCHVKDAGPLPERKMLDVGAGTIDFAALIAKGKTGALKHWFIEHDNPSEPLASVATSAAAMRSM